MAQYCDPKKLEQNWFLWLVARTTPELELFRQRRSLWTSVARDILPQTASTDNFLRNPVSQSKTHCIVSSQLYYFGSLGGQLTPDGVKLPELSACTSLTELQLAELKSSDFFEELPISITWNAICCDIMSMCAGIATKFHLQDADEYEELAADAQVQVIDKINKLKLMYIPGKGSIFGLVTTTIFNCMYSIINKRNKNMQRSAALAENVRTGVVRPTTRTLRAMRLPKTA